MTTHTNTDIRPIRLPVRPFASFLRHSFESVEWDARMDESRAGGEDVNTIAPWIDALADALRAEPSRDVNRRGDIVVTAEERDAYRAYNRAEREGSLRAFRAKYGHDVPTIRL